jgi:hypothetical protein
MLLPWFNISNLQSSASLSKPGKILLEHPKKNSINASIQKFQKQLNKNLGSDLFKLIDASKLGLNLPSNGKEPL